MYDECIEVLDAEMTEAYNSWELSEFEKKANNPRAWERRGDSIGLPIDWSEKSSRGRKKGWGVIQLLTPDNYRGPDDKKRHGKYKTSIELPTGERRFIGDFDSEDKAKKELIKFMTDHIKKNTR